MLDYSGKGYFVCPLPMSVCMCGPAGLAAYVSWAPTIRRLLTGSAGVVCLFTDYCEEAAERAMSMLQALGAQTLMPITVNPFRSPLSCTGDDNRLPSYSNAFMFGFVT